MYPQHLETIAKVTAYFAHRAEVLAVLLTGSVAHGFARENSDVDIAIIVTEPEFERRKARSELTFYDTSLSTYADGYVDGKYMDLAFIRDVAERGSEPARFAFKDARILLSEVDGLDELLAAASRYSDAQKEAKLVRLQAQFEAWYWYVQQAFQTQDRYLLSFASAKLALFGARQILAHNNLLFPYHKWLSKVLAQAPSKPALLLDHMEALLQGPTPETAAAFYADVTGFVPRIPSEQHWSVHFMIDSELNWMSGQTPVDDL